jgi:hypothetical protein
MNRKVKPRADPVEVFSRIRPVGDTDGDLCLKILDENNLMLQIQNVRPRTSRAR